MPIACGGRTRRIRNIALHIHCNIRLVSYLFYFIFFLVYPLYSESPADLLMSLVLWLLQVHFPVASCRAAHVTRSCLINLCKLGHPPPFSEVCPRFPLPHCHITMHMCGSTRELECSNARAMGDGRWAFCDGFTIGFASGSSRVGLRCFIDANTANVAPWRHASLVLCHNNLRQQLAPAALPPALAVG